MEKEIILTDGTKITMREPKVRDMMIVGEETNNEKKEVAMVANLCNLTIDEVADMSLKDYSLIQKELKGFLS